VKITADTNILVRVIVHDDASQAQTALRVLAEAKAVLLPMPCLCEFAWVLEKSYRLSRPEIASAIRAITQRANVETDVDAVGAGLRVLDAGGDFADGVIAAAGAAMGGEIFVSFDQKAVSRLGAVGMSARLPTSFA
jgi:predicted nucleic-acid-binding protein